MIPGVLQAQKRATGVQGSARDAEWQAGVPPECPEVCARGVPLGPENAPGGGACEGVGLTMRTCEHAPPPT